MINAGGFFSGAVRAWLVAGFLCSGSFVLAEETDGVRVGVYKPADMIAGDVRVRADAIADALNKEDGISAVCISKVDSEKLREIDVLIVPNQHGRTGSLYVVNDAERRALVREWVMNGGGLMTTHDAVGYRAHRPVIPEVAYGVGNHYTTREPYSNRLCVDAAHPVTKGLDLRDIFTTAYFDYITLQPGENGQVVLRGVEEVGGRLFAGPPAVVAGAFGKGRYVACGPLMGGLAPAGLPELPINEELAALVNSVRYLAGVKGWDHAFGESIGQGAFLAEVEHDDDGEEILPGVSIKKVLDACQIRHEAEWRDSDAGSAPALNDVPDGTPVLTDEQYERCVASEHYNRFPESWQRIDLCGEWRFMEVPDTKDNPENDAGTINGFWKIGFNDSDWGFMKVPTPSRGRNNPFHGVQWYRRTFEVPAVESASYVLRFAGVIHEAKVYVNGEEAGFHQGYGYPFEMDITKLVKPGAANVIAVRNYDRPVHFSAYCMGLYESVELHIRPEIYVHRLLVNTPVSDPAVEIKAEIVNNGYERTVEITALLDPYESSLVDIQGARAPSSSSLGQVNLKSGMNSFDFKVNTEHPVLWTPENPSLYEIKLVSDGTELGKARFGFREFEADGHCFFLNGKRVYISGLILREEMFLSDPFAMFPEHPMGVNERRIMGYKNMGFNLLKTDSYWRTERFFDACDEIGMMVFSVNGALRFFGPPYEAEQRDITLWARANLEPPADVKVNEAYVRNMRRYFRDKLHNHPSVVIKAVSSEARSDVYQRSHKAAVDAIRSVDMQSRPLCAVSGGSPNIATFTFSDFEDFHIYPGMICGHGWDHKQLLFDANREVWRYVGEVKPVINFEAIGCLPLVNNDEVENVRKLWSAEPLDKAAIVADIEGRDAAYHMAYGARWMSVYGVRRMIFDDYEQARNEKRLIPSPFYNYIVKHGLIAGRLAGDLFQGFGLNSTRFWDAFTYVGIDEADRRSLKGRPITSYDFADIYRGDRNLLDFRLGSMHAFNTWRRYINRKLVCLNPAENKNCFAGQPYKATLYAINDTSNDSPDWSIRSVIYNGKREKVYDGTSDIGSVPSGKRKLVPFEWMILGNKPTQTYTVELFLYENGEIVSDSSFDFHALGVEEFAGAVDTRGKKVAIYDVADNYGLPMLSSAAVLDELGVKYDRIKGFDTVSEYDVLLIGAASSDRTVHESGVKIAEWIGSGGRMVIFEQVIPGQLPVVSGMSITKKYGGSVLDMVDPAHPVFKGLQVNDYWSLWNGELPTADHYGGEGGIYAALIGPLNETVVATGVREVPRASTKAVQMVMADVKMGDGMVFLTQAEATRRYGKDSVATKYLRNVVEYALSDITDFSTPLPEFVIAPMDFYNFGYIDMTDRALEDYDSDVAWRDLVQNQGLTDLGELRFVVQSAKALHVSAAGGPFGFDLSKSVKLMYPEREAEKVIADRDQGSLNIQDFDSFYILHAARGGSTGEKIGEYVFTYMDGATEIIDIIIGGNIGVFTENQRLTGGVAVGGGFYVTAWLNPHPGRKLRTWTVRCSASDTEVLVGAATALLIREKIHD